VRGVVWVAVLSGPLVALGYLAGGAVRPVVARRWPRPPAGAVPALEAALALGWATLAWQLTRAVAPRAGEFRSASAIGFLSPQVLTAWASVALWAGLAVVVGTMAPAWTGWRRGGSGLPAAAALTAVHAPAVLLGAGTAFFAAQVARASLRNATAVAVAAVPVLAWWLWVIDGPTLWGAINGPEVTLWATVTAGALLARWARGDVGRFDAGP
jgi:glycerol-3-phosphate acyltransferase PlsY